MLSNNLRARLAYALSQRAAADEFASKLQLGGLLTTGNVFWASSVVGSDTNNGGLGSDSPKATLAEAYNLCVASQGDVVILMPGHNENIANAQLTLGKIGVTVLGLGWGSLRPRFDYDHANASIDITASAQRLVNLLLLPSVTDVAIGIDINAAVTDTLLQDVETLPGEDGAGVDELVLGVDVKAGCDRTRIVNYRQRQHASAAGIVAGISLTGASDDILIEAPDIVAKGAGVTAPIQGVTTLSTNVHIIGGPRKGRLVSDNEPGIEVVTGTTGVIEDIDIFTDLATIAAATVADGMAHFRVRYVEVGNESDAAVKTASVDD